MEFGEVTRALGRVARRTTDWRFFSWYWGDAIAIDGLLAAGDVLDQPGLRDVAAEALDRWARSCPSSLDDALAPGSAIARLSGDAILDNRASDRFLAAVDRLPLLTRQIPALEPHRPDYRFGVCIDALYHLPPGLASIGRIRDDPALIQRGVTIAEDILAVTRCPDGWAQWYDAALGRNNAIAWSRGVGWALLGCLDTIACATGAVPVAALEDAATEMLDALVATQERDGHWAAVLRDPVAPAETSTAAFFVAAAHHPCAPGAVQRGGPSAGPSAAAGRALRACLAAVGPDGGYTGVSADVLPRWQASDYRSFEVMLSPWGQGAALRALAAAASASH